MGLPSQARVQQVEVTEPIAEEVVVVEQQPVLLRGPLSLKHRRPTLTIILFLLILVPFLGSVHRIAQDVLISVLFQVHPQQCSFCRDRVEGQELIC